MRVLKESYRILAALVLGACAGWMAEFLGYYMLLFALPFGYGAGELMCGLWKKKSKLFRAIAVPILMAIGAVLGRLAVAKLLLLSAPELTPPLGAWQAIVGLLDPSPTPLIILVITLVVGEYRIVINGCARRNLTRKRTI